MRIYVPLTLPQLARFRDDGRYGGTVWTAHAVTPALREWYAESDTEELEHAAFLDAERSCLRLLSGDAGAARIRVVLSADVPDGTATAAGDDLEDRSVVLVRGDLSTDSVASVHVDEHEAWADVASATDALAAAAAGDDDAQFVVDGAEGRDLLWYDASELHDLVDRLVERYVEPGSDRA